MVAVFTLSVRTSGRSLVMKALLNADRNKAASEPTRVFVNPVIAKPKRDYR